MTYNEFYQSIPHYFSDRWDKKIIVDLNCEKYELKLEEIEGRPWKKRFEPKLVKLENQNEIDWR